MKDLYAVIICGLDWMESKSEHYYHKIIIIMMVMYVYHAIDADCQRFRVRYPVEPHVRCDIGPVTVL